MKHILSYIAATAFSIIVIGTALAFTEPTGTPPTNNVPAPLNVGAGTQEKAGGLVMQSMKATSITLGESTRTSWLDAASACNWEGWKCNCRANESSFAALQLTLGMQCSGGQLRDFKIMDMQISSRDKQCASSIPTGCTPALYTYENDVSGSTSVISSVGNFFEDLFDW